ncbi:MAG TPA: diaminopimelate epimerase [Rhizomicrobium sp.]|jgi:diaminopimelate epimerase|nr:diaminopimelate epimerase [Rhizomicrobium sp.]
MTAFLKMHGLGNDFAVFDARKQALALDAATARAIADRRLGVGCDQVIVIAPAANGADAAMRIYNSDGGEVESCGNAARCVAQLLMAEKGAETIRLETVGGPLVCSQNNGLVTVDMGAPRFEWKDVPLASAVDTNKFSFSVDGVSLEASALSVGNPHCVIFVGDAENAPVSDVGPLIEHHSLFPERVNVEFATVQSRGRIRMRVWERGAGITQACGTGACATAVAAARRGLSDRKVDVVLDGGTLTIEWRESDGHILMTGPATLAWRGEIDLTTGR